MRIEIQIRGPNGSSFRVSCLDTKGMKHHDEIKRLLWDADSTSQTKRSQPATAFSYYISMTRKKHGTRVLSRTSRTIEPAILKLVDQWMPHLKQSQAKLHEAHELRPRKPISGHTLLKVSSHLRSRVGR
jgi:hypothetical protein